MGAATEAARRVPLAAARTAGGDRGKAKTGCDAARVEAQQAAQQAEQEALQYLGGAARAMFRREAPPP